MIRSLRRKGVKIVIFICCAVVLSSIYNLGAMVNENDQNVRKNPLPGGEVRWDSNKTWLEQRMTMRFHGPLQMNTGRMRVQPWSEKVPPQVVTARKAIVTSTRPQNHMVSEAKAKAFPEHKLLTDSNDTITTWPWGKLEGCAQKNYGDLTQLPKVSVIICFHDNEKSTHILHTLHSVVQRTPAILLKEILLIDDNSKKAELKDLMENYINAVFNGSSIRFIRSKVSLGLIKARNLGAQMATGDVILCMDSHMEVQPGWIEPVLYEIKLNRKTLAASYVDFMDNNSGQWKYTFSASNWIAYFDWNFVFGWQAMSPEEELYHRPDKTAPIKSPVYIGTIFAMDREYFLELGGFDTGMEGWGGENLDLPFRVWMCGGRVVMLPCSHAGHLEAHGHRDYRAGWNHMIRRNYKRVIEVWLDGYKEYTDYYMPWLKDIDVGDISDRLTIRKKCPHDFKWFLKNIFPQLGLIWDNSLAFGNLKNLATNDCLASPPPNHPNMEQCESSPDRQTYFWSGIGELRMQMHAVMVINGGSDHYSLQLNEYFSLYNLSKANTWIHWKDGPLIETKTGLCLESKIGRPDNRDARYLLTKCDLDSQAQKWAFSNYTQLYNKLFTEGRENLENDFLKAIQDKLKYQNIVNSPNMNFVGAEKEAINDIKVPYATNIPKNDGAYKEKTLNR